ncbi:MAG: type VI secretion system baseplate subunit TssG [Pyrinomonadaceae bacterium]
MATEKRRTDPPLDEELFDEAFRFEFFQAVRLLERIEPDREPVGRDTPPSREVVRFRTRQTLSFPASEIYEITRDAEEPLEAQPDMMVAFMGLTGPLGVLPHHYTELVMDRARYKDTALWAFLDIFNHRMISLFYRMWEKHRFPVAYERGELDQFTSYLFDITGMGTGGLRGRSSFDDQALIYYGGLVAQRPHSASAIAAIISDYFSVPARVVQFSGQWLSLDDNVTRLGAAFSNLGVNTIAGSRVWDSQSKFRIRLGPLSFHEFKTFVPDGSAFRPINELLQHLVGLEFDFDLQLVLKAADVPPCQLRASSADGPKLGWTSWLKTRDRTTNDEQVVL